jgi:hypothetical protein
MKNPLSPSRRLLLLSLGLGLLASTSARAQNNNPPQPVQPAIPAAPATPTTSELQGYTYEQRSDFTTAVQAAASKLDAQIAPLTKRQKGGIAGGADAMTLEKVQSSRTELGHLISQLEDTTPENWNSLRDTVLASLAQTQEAYEKAAKE